jgi:hypothetical protein
MSGSRLVTSPDVVRSVRISFVILAEEEIVGLRISANRSVPAQPWEVRSVTATENVLDRIKTCERETYRETVNKNPWMQHRHHENDTRPRVLSGLMTSL